MNQNFTDKELWILSDAILNMQNTIGQAGKTLMSCGIPIKENIESKHKELMVLNSKVLSYLEEKDRIEE